MLAEGKRQYAFWLTEEQAAEIRAYLAGEASLLTPARPEKAPEAVKPKPKPSQVTPGKPTLHRADPAALPIPAEHQGGVEIAYRLLVNDQQVGIVWKYRISKTMATWCAKRAKAGSVLDALGTHRTYRTRKQAVDALLGG